MPPVKNKRYKAFLDQQIIEYIRDEHIERALGNIRHSRKAEARALLILLYYTGARPAELLELMGKSLWKDGNYINIKLVGKKGGFTRIIKVSSARKWIMEAYHYSNTVMDNLLLFPNFISKYKRNYVVKSGEVREAKETSAKINYWIYKWFDFMGEEAPNAYFFRHNRFSHMSESGATPQQIRIMKGSKTVKSVEPYIHLSSSQAKQTSRFVGAIK